MYWHNIATVLGLSALPFELFDFDPPLLYRTFDGHALWHGGGVLVALAWTRWARAYISSERDAHRALRLAGLA